MQKRSKRSQPKKKSGQKLHHRVVHHLKNHFVPHKGNDFTPNLIQHRALLVYSGLLITAKAALLIVGIALPSASLYSFSLSEQNIVNLTNEARQNAGLTQVTPNVTLRGAAQAKADDMVIRNYFSHEGPEGESPWTWLNRSGYQYSAAGENLAIHYTTAEALEQGWLASPYHRKNILDERFSEIGIGVASGKVDGYDSTVVVQLFATPKTYTTQLAAATKPTLQPPQDDSEATTVLKGNVLAIQLEAPNAVAVNGHAGEVDIPFTQEQASDTWVASVDPKKLDSSDEIYATVFTSQSAPDTKLVAFIVKDDQVGNLYRTQPTQEVRLFGLSITGLGDMTRNFFIATLIGLATLVLLNIFIKFHIQRPGIIAHAIGVMGLAILLIAI